MEIGKECLGPAGWKSLPSDYGLWDNCAPSRQCNPGLSLHTPTSFRISYKLTLPRNETEAQKQNKKTFPWIRRATWIASHHSSVFPHSKQRLSTLSCTAWHGCNTSWLSWSKKTYRCLREWGFSLLKRWQMFAGHCETHSQTRSKLAQNPDSFGQNNIFQPIVLRVNPAKLNSFTSL